MTDRWIDHVAVAVRDLDEAIRRWEAITGRPARDRQISATREVEVAFFDLGDTKLELIQPLEDDGGVARYLERRGESLHHLALRVDDIVHELESLRSQGLEPIDAVPRPGSHGLIAFLHPRTTGGVLIELVQPGMADGGGEGG